MKNKYKQPDLVVLHTEQHLLLTEGSTDTTPAHNDDPQNPGNSLGRRYSVWDDGDY